MYAGRRFSGRASGCHEVKAGFLIDARAERMREIEIVRRRFFVE